MTPRQLRAAERLAPAIAVFMIGGGPIVGGDRPDRGVTCDAFGNRLVGDQQRGWSAAFASRRSVVRGQPPDTVAGLAGWLAAHIAWSPT